MPSRPRRPRIVRHVGEDDRASVGGESTRDRLGDRQPLVDELVAVGPRAPGQLFGEPFRELRRAVGDHVDAEARVRDVRVRKPAKIDTEITRGSRSISAARS